MLTAFCLLFFSALCADEETKKSLEIFAFFNKNFSSIRTTYENHFRPNFYDTSISQTLTIQGKGGEGFLAGLSYFISDKFGLKLSLNGSKNTLGGENSPYEIHLQYITMPPPDYIAREIIRDESRGWLATQGNLRSLSFSLNLQYRLYSSPKTTMTFSAGSGFSRISGNFNYLGYSEYWLGGHSVLFSEGYLLMVKIPAFSKIGFNADVELGFFISKNISLAARIAYLAWASFSVQPAIDGALIYHSLKPASEEKLVEIINRLSLNLLNFNPSFFSLSFGIKYALPL